MEQLRAARPDIAVTTDLIAGFPGETEADYAATRDLVERAEFDNAFVFRYSKRRDTPAADLPLPDSGRGEGGTKPGPPEGGRSVRAGEVRRRWSAAGSRSCV